MNRRIGFALSATILTIPSGQSAIDVRCRVEKITNKYSMLITTIILITTPITHNNNNQMGTLIILQLNVKEMNLHIIKFR